MIKLNHVLVTVTRDCNLNCKHCLCGEPKDEYMNVNSNYVENLLLQIDKIKRLTITGGEPFLHVEGIIDILKAVNYFRDKVESVGIVTNGLVCNKNDSDLLSRIADVAVNTPLYISVSNDNYHPNMVNKNFIYIMNRIAKINPLITFEIRKYHEITARDLIESPRTKKYNIESNIKHNPRQKIKIKIDEKGYIEKPRVTLTVKGNIVLSDILTWEQEDKEENIFCRVENFKNKFEIFLKK